MGSHDAYDVVIAGASFAGLAVAARLRGLRVLVVDRKVIGTRQTSACAVVLSTLQALGLEGAVCQVHHRLVVHTERRTFTYPLDEPYCTFDYARLCHLLWRRSDAEFALTPVLGMDDGAVRTAEGSVRATAVVDATGWRATLAESVRPGYVRANRLGLAVETATPFRGEGLHFWHLPTGQRGVDLGWAFPLGETGHVGVASYSGYTRLAAPLGAFLRIVGAEGRGVHGGRFPTALRDPVAGGVFVVGDAAGQCLGITAEGIRPALYFGTRLGELLRRALDGCGSLDDARVAYKALVEERRRAYRALSGAHHVMSRLPLPVARAVPALADRLAVHRMVLPRYVRALALEPSRSRAGRVG